MPIKVKNQGNRKVIERLRGLLVGVNKTGKSWTAATARKPNLFADIDLREESLSGKEGVYTWSPTNPPGNGMQPTVYNQVLGLVGELENSLRLGDITDIDGEDADKNIQTLVVDSAQSLSREILKFNMYANPGELARKITIAGQDHLYPKGTDTWMSDMECFESLIQRIVSIPNLDFWLVFHEETSEDGKIKFFPNRYRNTTRYFNEVWRITRNGDVPEAQLSPSYEFTACTTLVGAPAVVQNPNIEELFQIYGRR